LTFKPLYPKINPTDYLDLARDLSSKTDNASIRSSIDRAYYATFLTCRDILALKRYILPTYSIEDHKNVPETLKSLKVLGSIGNDELRLRHVRNRITYDTRSLTPGQSTHEDVYNTTLILSSAQKIIDHVQSLPDNPNEPKIQ
jgi:hypothetical protein